MSNDDQILNEFPDAERGDLADLLALCRDQATPPRKVNLLAGIREQLPKESRDNASESRLSVSRFGDSTVSGQDLLDKIHHAGQAKPVDLRPALRERLHRTSSRRLAQQTSNRHEVSAERRRILSLVALGHVAALALLGVWLNRGDQPENPDMSAEGFAHTEHATHVIDPMALRLQLEALEVQHQTQAQQPEFLEHATAHTASGHGGIGRVGDALMQSDFTRFAPARQTALRAMRSLVTEQPSTDVLYLSSVSADDALLLPTEVLAWRAWALAEHDAPEALAAYALARDVAGGVLSWRESLPLQQAASLLQQEINWQLNGQDALSQALQDGLTELQADKVIKVLSPDQLDPVSQFAWTHVLRLHGGDPWDAWQSQLSAAQASHSSGDNLEHSPLDYLMQLMLTELADRIAQ